MKFLDLIRESEFISNTAILMSGTVVAQILPIIFSPLMSRLFSPTDFSVYGVFISLYSILGVVITLRYDMAIMLPKESQKAKNIVNLCLVNSILFTFVIIFLVLLFGENIIELFKIKAIGNWFLLLPIAAFFLSVNNFLIIWYNRNKQYRTISENRISRSTMNTGANIILGFAKCGHSGLILSQVISDGLTASFYLIKYYSGGFHKKISTLLTDLRAVALEYRDFPTFSLPTTLIDTFSQQAPILLITAFFSSTLSGSYFFAARILAAPAALIGFAYSQTFFQKFTSYIQISDYETAKKFLYRSWALLLSFIAIPAITLLFWGEPLFSFVFGNEWSESGAISSILIFYIVFSFVSSPTSSIYIALRMQHYSLLFGVAVLIYRFSSFYIGYLMGDFYLALKILVICEVIEIVTYNSLAVNKIRLLSVGA